MSMDLLNMNNKLYYFPSQQLYKYQQDILYLHILYIQHIVLSHLYNILYIMKHYNLIKISIFLNQ